ncbi:hypothetical protein Y032_0010g1056 [Ancylostoma ceylanicum]|uniref:SCP domain-containing protein n=1 Tax=Ancylostoma ceylanicum TaxID=53326 RepID=A0A016VHL2_9BILA|nr:hypothetical protein Y032_0010g1056 [Ancylostoma ceylanicum]
MLSALVVLFLCVGNLLAQEKKWEPISCNDAKENKERDEMRGFILWYHNRFREQGLQKVVSYDCDLEKKARSAFKGAEVDTSKLTKYDVLHVDDELTKGKPTKDYLDRAMEYWYRYEDNFYKAKTNRVGCAYKRDDFFHFVCVYNQLSRRRPEADTGVNTQDISTCSNSPRLVGNFFSILNEFSEKVVATFDPGDLLEHTKDLLAQQCVSLHSYTYNRSNSSSMPEIGSSFLTLLNFGRELVLNVLEL